jgi:hypothetical protein
MNMNGRLIIYVLMISYLLAGLDWWVIHATRWQNRAWLDWMHAHERQYALVTRWGGWILGGPAMALKPIFYNAFMSVQASQQEKEAITHAPRMNLSGFYHLPVRGEGWTFTSWAEWFVYWFIPSLTWWFIVPASVKMLSGRVRLRKGDTHGK